MTNEEAINYLKHDCRKLCQDCYPEIGRGGSEICDFCNEVQAYDMAIEALEKQIIIKRKIEWLKWLGEYEAINVGHILDAFEDCAIDWSDSK